jgi:hypothetical protein
MFGIQCALFFECNAGLVKILKKYDKRTGGVLSLPFTQRARHEPFFATEQLTRLVRECEANLELLFPIEAEVLEPGSSSNLEQNDDVASRDPTSSCDVETSDVYRSTVAAMKAIQGLQKASSTYNPLSLSRFFDSLDGEACSGMLLLRVQCQIPLQTHRFRMLRRIIKRCNQESKTQLKGSQM